MTHLLEVKALTKRFGGLTAVSGVSFAVDAGEILGIIGPNGAGKSTLFNVIAGLYRQSEGTVLFEAENISGKTSDAISRCGIGRTFQSVHVFGEQTVAENLRRAEVMARCHNPVAYLGRHEPGDAARIDEVAHFVGLADYLALPAGGQAYGLQKILGVGMALMGSPRLLLMDEPAAGLNPSEKRMMGELIRRLRKVRGITVLLVEHDMPLVMGCCDRILVINQGKPIALGAPAEIKSDPTVIDAYLGEDYEFA